MASTAVDTKDAKSTYTPKPGRVGNLTVIQGHTLEKFRKEIQDEGYFDPARHDDAALLRFLRARKFDLAATKTMFIDCEKWRKEFGVEDIAKNFEFPEKEKVNTYYPQFYHKMDKEGQPVYIEQLGKLDLKALYAITTEDRLLKQFVHENEVFTNERLQACAAEVGHPVETSCTILDLSGVGLAQFYRVKDYVSKTSSIGQNRYPERMGKFYIINAPYLFSTVWALIKPWLDEVTVAKIQILGSGYKTALLAQIPEENLPKEFGGKCSCPGGCSLADEGPWKKAQTKPAA